MHTISERVAKSTYALSNVDNSVSYGVLRLLLHGNTAMKETTHVTTHIVLLLEATLPLADAVIAMSRGDDSREVWRHIQESKHILRCVRSNRMLIHMVGAVYGSVCRAAFEYALPRRWNRAWLRASEYALRRSN